MPNGSVGTMATAQIANKRSFNECKIGPKMSRIEDGGCGILHRLRPGMPPGCESAYFMTANARKTTQASPAMQRRGARDNPELSPRRSRSARSAGSSLLEGNSELSPSRSKKCNSELGVRRSIGLLSIRR